MAGRLLLAHGNAIDVSRVSSVSAEQVRTLPFGIMAVICGALAVSGIGFVLSVDPSLQAATPAFTWLGIWLFTVASLLSALKAFTASHWCNVVVSTYDGHSVHIPLRGREQAAHLARALYQAMAAPVRRTR